MTESKHDYPASQRSNRSHRRDPRRTGAARLDYSRYAETGKKLTIQESLARISEVNDIAEVQGEDFLSIGSTSIGPPDWLKLAGRIDEIFAKETSVAGVVVTHGTATLERRPTSCTSLSSLPSPW